MRTRIGTGVAAAVAAAVALALATAEPGGASPPKPLAPDAAAALVAATPSVSSGSTVRAVSASEALTAASTPGASVWSLPGLSLRQAVGAVAAQTTAAASAVVAAAAAFTGCWANAAWRQWGTWPYEQKITDTTYWCAVIGGKITYRTSTPTASGTFCGVGWRDNALVGGGAGFTWFTIRTSAGFSCPTVIPWVVLHPSHWMDVTRNSRGETSLGGSG
jgi:hypothetical protein